MHGITTVPAALQSSQAQVTVSVYVTVRAADSVLVRQTQEDQ
jgi:hypothetical protein